MAITLVGTPTVGSAINGGDITLALPSGLQENDLVFVCFLLSENAVSGGTSSSGWTQETTDATNSNLRQQRFYKFMGASPDANIVLLGSGNGNHSSSAIAIAFRGVDLTTPIDATTTTTNGNSTNPNPPTITPATSGAVIVAAGGSRLVDTTGTDGPTGYNNFTQVSSSDNQDTTSYLAWKGGLTGSVPEDPDPFTGVSSGQWIATSSVFRPAAVVAAGRFFGTIF